MTRRRPARPTTTTPALSSDRTLHRARDRPTSLGKRPSAGVSHVNSVTITNCDSCRPTSLRPDSSHRGSTTGRKKRRYCSLSTNATRDHHLRCETTNRTESERSSVGVWIGAVGEGLHRHRHEDGFAATTVRRVRGCWVGMPIIATQRVSPGEWCSSTRSSPRSPTTVPGMTFRAHVGPLRELQGSVRSGRRE